MQFEFVSDYKNNKALRSSFNRLACSTFGISFEEYYSRGLWDDTYVCHSYVCNGEIVSNISASHMEIIRDGKQYRAAQLGAVMTAPKYRKKGLAAALMRYVLAKYESQCDFIYLFANSTVLDFYPKFDFVPCTEYNFSLASSTLSSTAKGSRVKFRRLDLSDAGDYRLLSSLSQERQPVSQTFGVKHHGVFMFNCLYGFLKNIFYSEKIATAVIYTKDNSTLDIYDIISKEKISVNDIISGLPAATNVRLHFTPDHPEMYISRPISEPDTTLFMRPGNAVGLKKFAFPETSHA